MNQRKKGILFLQMVCYLCFLVEDFWGISIGIEGIWLKYFSILLVLAYLLVYSKKEVDKNDYLFTIVAIILTCIADYCLLLKTYYLSGICFFIFVQFFYGKRLGRKGITMARHCLIVAVITCLFWPRDKARMDGTLVMAIVYGSLLLWHVYLAWVKDTNKIFAMALSLLVCCDLSIVFFHIGEYVRLEATIWGIGSNIAGKLVWLFYLPSQVCLQLSVKKITNDKK